MTNFLTVIDLLVVSLVIRCYDDAGAPAVTTALPNGVPTLTGRSGPEPMSQTEVVCRRSSMTIRTMAALAVIGATSSTEVAMLDLRGLLADIPEMKGHAPGEDQEYVNGWGIFALPFESGDVLALRVFPQNDFGPYRALWHRDPSGRWAIHVDGSRLDASCPRYFGSVCEYTGFAGIDVTWVARNSLRIRMTDPSLDWTVTAHSTRVLTFVNAVSAKLPLASWRPQTLVRARERIAHRLGMGHIQLNGVMPSGHIGHLMPEQMFFIDEARATLNGADLGRPVRLPSNPTIGEFRLPSRGVLVKGGALWDILNPVEYERTRAATGAPVERS